MVGSMVTLISNLCYRALTKGGLEPPSPCGSAAFDCVYLQDSLEDQPMWLKGHFLSKIKIYLSTSRLHVLYLSHHVKILSPGPVLSMHGTKYFIV